MAMMVPIMAKPIGREIGEKLRQIAAAKGLTQGQVGANAHVSQPTVSQLFNGGTSDPPIGTIMKIARVLGVTLDELVGIKPLQIPEPGDLGTNPDQLASRVSALESDLLEIAKGQREILKALGAQGERSPSRKRPKTA